MMEEYIICLLSKHSVPHKDGRKTTEIDVRIYLSLSSDKIITTDINKATRFRSKIEAENLLGMLEYSEFKVVKIEPTTR